MNGAEGAFIDPVTGDFLFSTFGGGDRVVSIQGFSAPLEDELGLADVVVYLDLDNDGTLDSEEPQTITDQDGIYNFSEVTPGTYTVRQTLLPGYVQTFPTNTPVVEVSSGSSVDNIDFAQVLTDEANRAPVFVNDPLESFSIPLPGTASGDVEPEFLNLSIGKNDTFFGSVSITLPDQGGIGGSADVVFVVDESGSMAGEHEWLTEIVAELDNALEARGITGNRYSLLGFGGSRNNAGVRNLTLPAQPDVQIYGPGNQLIDQQLANSPQPGFSLSGDGEYTVVVSTDEDGSLDYSFEVSAEEAEPTAPTGFDQILGGSITAGEQQTFTFKAPAGQKVWFDSISATSRNIRGTLFDPEGKVVIEDQVDRDIEPFSLLKSGTYTWVIDGGSDGGDYRFQFLNMSDAPVLPLDIPISDTIEPETTQVFQFEGSVGQRLYFDSLDATTFGDWSLYGPNDNRLDSSIVSGDLEAILPGDGTYWLVLENSTSDLREYSFEVVTPSASIINLTLDDVVEGTLSEAGELAIYQFEGNAGQGVFFDGLESSPRFGVEAELYDPSGERLFISTTQRDEGIVTLSTTGTYSLLIGGEDTIGDYSFQLKDVDLGLDIDLDVSVSDTLQEGQSTKIYKLLGQAGQTLQFESTGVSSSFVGRWQLFSPANAEISDISLNESFESVLPDDGEYRLVITSRQSDPLDYSLLVTDVSESAGALTGLGTISSETIATNEEQTYTFTAPAGTRILLDTLGASERSIQATLTAPDGMNVGRTVRLNSSNPDPYLIPESGSYTLSITGGDTGGDYSFRLLSFEDATSIALDTTVEVTLPIGKETQLYAFEGSAGTRLRFDLDQDASDTLGLWNLFYPGGGESSAIATNFRRDIDVVLPGDGKYVLALQGTSSEALDVSFQVLTPETQIQALTLGQAVTGSIDESGEIDLYTFNGTKGQKIRIDALDTASGEIKARLISPAGARLFGGGRQLISPTSISGLLGDQTLEEDIGLVTLPEDGTYTLRIAAEGNLGSYSFQINDVARFNTLLADTNLVDTLSNDNKTQYFQFEGGVAGQTLRLSAPAGLFFSDITQLSDDLEQLSTDRGGFEDGYAGLNEALQLPFRNDAATNIILITDEARSNVEQDLDFDKIQSRVDAQDALLTSVLNAKFEDENQASALGLDADDNVYIADGNGGFAISKGGVFTGSEFIFFGDTETIEQDYVDLTFATDGTTWDLNQLRAGGDAAVSFTKAFVELQAEEIGEQFLVDVQSGDPDVDFTNQTGEIAGLGGGETASFDVEITGDGTAQSFELLFTRPESGFVLGSVPVVVNQSYTYPALAVDPDGDLLTYSLITAPEGANIGASTGAVNWNPPAVGTYDFSIQADDGRGGVAVQDFAVVVRAVNADNKGPSITSTPAVTSVDANQTFTYDVEASDPDGDLLSYYLLQAPSGLDINQTTGEMSWTPTNEQAGTSTVEVIVLDGKGKSANQQFELSVSAVAPNASPSFISSPITTTLAGEVYQYQVRAVDPEEDTLTYRLLQQPAGMQIDAETGLVTWQSDLISSGEYSVVVAVEDGVGNTTLQTFQLTASDEPILDTLAPEIELVSNGNLVNKGESVTLQVRATDDRDLASLSLEIDGTSLILTPNTLANGQLYTATTQLDASGVYSVVAEAKDSAGNVTTEEIGLRVLDPSDTSDPEVILDISGIQVGTTISEPFDILGSVNDENLASYRVEYAQKSLLNPDSLLEENSAYVLLNESRVAVDGVLATLDPRFLVNDQYMIRVTAFDVNGAGTVRGFEIGVLTENKVGNFTLDAADLSLPLTGIPINVQRRYDTLQANSSASFGYGWEFAGLDARITESAPQEPEGLEGILFANKGFRFGDRVTLTTPDGERVGFTFKPEAAIAGFLGTAFRPVFVPDPGVEETLTVEDIYLSQKSDGTFGLYLFSFGYNPSEYQLTTKNNLTYTYNQFTGLQTVADLNGNVLTYGEDGITSSTGETVRFERDSDDRITNIIDPAGNSIRYEYDANGDLVAVTDRAGNTTQYDYDPDQPHYLTEEIDPLGRSSVRTEFDDFGRIERIIDAEGNALEIDIDFDGPTDTQVITDPLDNTTILTYDDRGNVIRQVDAEGGVTEYEYFDSDMLKSVSDPRGFKTAYTYDERGNLLTETDPLGNKTTNTYNNLNQVLTTEDARGNTTINRYNDNGMLKESEDAVGNVTKYDYFADGNLKTITDANDNDTNYRYDRFGRLEEVEDALGAVTRFGYDNAGNLKTITTPLGNTTTFGYDAQGQVVKVTDAKGNSTQIQYNAAGDRSAVIDALGRRTEYKYNSRGLQTEIRYADETSSKTVYDVLDRVAEEIDQNGNETEFDYDGLGRLIEVTDALGHETEYRYDKSGNLTEQIDALGRTTQFNYDELNRLIKTTLPLGQVETQAYDKVGNLKTLTNFNQQTITYEYDPNNLLQAVRLPDAPDELYTYMPKGEIDTITDARGVTDYDYDETGQLLRRTDPDDAFVAYTYDVDGNIETLTSPSGTVGYTYNELGLLETVTDRQDNLTTYSYDSIGNLTETQFANGIVETRDYDLLNRPTFIENVDRNNNLVSSYEYTLDKVGNRKVLTEDTGRTVKYTYDDLYRLTEEAVTDAVNGDRITGYEYDDVGNRLEKTDSVEGTTNYNYDDNDRLQIEESDSVISSYKYDDAGNLVTTAVDGEIRVIYSWNSKDELSTSMTRKNGIEQTIEFEYNTDGIRVVSKADGDTTSFLIEVDQQEFAQVVEEYSKLKESVTAYTYGLDLISQKIGSSTTFYHTDALGSSRLSTSLSGDILNSYLYDAYGNVTSQLETIENSYKYTGEPLDNILESYYLRARYYDPSNGRFLSRDQFSGFLERPLSLNKYGYVEGNPINATDPSGNVSSIETAILLGTVSGLSKLTARANCFEAREKYSSVGNTSDLLIAFAEGFVVGAVVAVRLKTIAVVISRAVRKVETIPVVAVGSQIKCTLS